MELKDKQARLAVMMLQLESLNAQVQQLKQEVIRDMSQPQMPLKKVEKKQPKQ